MALFYDSNAAKRLSEGQIRRRGLDPASDLTGHGIYPLAIDYPATYHPDVHVAVDVGTEGTPETGYHVTWRLDMRQYTDEERAAKLTILKTAKLAEIKLAADAALEPLAASYPGREVQSWPQQISEATAYTANASAAVPLLRTMAAERPSLGETEEARVAELARRILANAAAWSAVAGPIIGKRQALEDAVGAATTLSGVVGVTVDFSTATATATATSETTTEAAA